MNGNPPAMTPEMCSALLAGSYAKWQSRYHRYPIAAPPAAQGLLPMSLARTRKVLQRTDGNAGAWKHTSWCVDRMLRACDHDEHRTLFPDDEVHSYCAGHGRAKKKSTETSLTDRTSWVDTDIDFDPASSTTTVTAWSAFTEVAEDTARDFFDLAKPANWQAGSGIFKQSVPGTWHAPTGSFLRANEDLGLNYQIFEQAEWNWSPEMSGGFVNILEITEYERKRYAEEFLGFDSKVLKKLFDDDPRIEAAMQPFTQALIEQHVDEPAFAIRYDYDLYRSLRSRNLGGWRSGGLTKDDGTYQAAWYPAKARDGGLLCIEIKKDLLFSRQVDVFEDYSSLLNLMAPALGSLLLEQLAHDGILPFLRGRH